MRITHLLLLMIIALLISGQSRIDISYINTYPVQYSLESGEWITAQHVPDGPITLAIENLSQYATMGELIVSRKGKAPVHLHIKSLENKPLIYQLYGNGQAFKILNVSRFVNTPISITLYSPELSQVVGIPMDGQFHPLNNHAPRMSRSQSGWMRIVFNSSGDFAAILLYRGMQPILYLLNADDCHKYDFFSGIPCHAKAGNQFVLESRFTGEWLYLVNLSPLTTRSVTVALIEL